MAGVLAALLEEEGARGVPQTEDDASTALTAAELALVHANLGETFDARLAGSREDFELGRHHLERRLEVETLARGPESAEGARPRRSTLAATGGSSTRATTSRRSPGCAERSRCARSRTV
mmetsp:Transcript_15011/g.60278  ORF Transcript_15011/g.60278 Transcript_15011/m.60278 type:complete len:120 (-) Transcript_15011:634-993(-)